MLINDKKWYLDWNLTNEVHFYTLTDLLCAYVNNFLYKSDKVV